jgi:hypothetical protein
MKIKKRGSAARISPTSPLQAHRERKKRTQIQSQSNHIVVKSSSLLESIAERKSSRTGDPVITLCGSNGVKATVLSPLQLIALVS